MSFARDRRIRNYTLVPFVVLGIVAGVLGGLGFGLGAFGEGAEGPRNPAGLVFFVAPLAVFWGLGWIAYRVAQRIVPVREDEDVA